jgi:hypothetical protein
MAGEAEAEMARARRGIENFILGGCEMCVWKTGFGDVCWGRWFGILEGEGIL